MSTLLFVRLELEFLKKFAISLKKNVAWCFTPDMGCPVPDSPDIDKKIIGVRVERTLARRLKVLSKQKKQTMSDVVRLWIIDGTRDIELTAEDYEQIAKEVRQAAKKAAKKSKS